MNLLVLQDSWMVGKGTVKYVYQHPLENDKLIKIIRPEIIHEDGGFKKHPWIKRTINQGIYRQFRREIIQYFELCKNNYCELDYRFPMEIPYGLIQTNMGLGLVVEKIVSPNGSPMNLKQLHQTGLLEKKHFAALLDFFERCKRMHLVFGEVNYEGLMYTEARNSKPEFVLVDGIGEKLYIPLRANLKFVNARYIDKVKKRILEKIS